MTKFPRLDEFAGLAQVQGEAVLPHVGVTLRHADDVAGIDELP